MGKKSNLEYLNVHYTERVNFREGEQRSRVLVLIGEFFLASKLRYTWVLHLRRIFYADPNSFIQIINL